MDVLTDMLHAFELKGWISSRTETTTPWRFEFTESQDVIFHILKAGHGLVCVDGETTPRTIGDGDVVLFPYGHAHTLCDVLDTPLTQALHLNYEACSEHQLFPFEGEDASMVMLCGALHFENPNGYPLLQCLPNVIHIPGEQGKMAYGFAHIIDLIARESLSSQPGSEVMLRRLTEMFFIQVMRVWIAQQAEANGGWLAALADQPIGAALGLIHQSPERGWKVEELAEAVALSRSAFSARFTRLVGESPMKYIARWRMHKATQMLRNNMPVEAIAHQLGYESDAAFRKAFKREIGMPPATYRQRGMFQA